MAIDALLCMLVHPRSAAMLLEQEKVVVDISCLKLLLMTLATIMGLISDGLNSLNRFYIKYVILLR